MIVRDANTVLNHYATDPIPFDTDLPYKRKIIKSPSGRYIREGDIHHVKPKPKNKSPNKRSGPPIITLSDEQIELYHTLKAKGLAQHQITLRVGVSLPILTRCRRLQHMDKEEV